jgi:CheY-like chemotaxis protein
MPAGASGDNLLVPRRGVRSQTNTQPASILLYMHAGFPGSATWKPKCNCPKARALFMNAGSSASAGINDPKFQSALRDAGYKLHAVGSRQELDEALKTGRYDILLADVADAPALEQTAQSAPSKPVLLPVVYNGTKAEAAAAEKRYGCVLKAPGRTAHYLAAIDKAMELRLSRESSRAASSR